MTTDLELYFANQKKLLFDQLPEFLNALENGQHPIVGDRDQALSVFREIEILLCLKNNLVEYNNQTESKQQITAINLEKLIRQTLIYGFTFLDDNGFSGGYDIDGKLYATNFHFFCSMVALLAVQEIEHENDQEIIQIINKVKNGVIKALPVLDQYANYKRKAYRGLNLIFIDIATIILAGNYFSETSWVTIGDKAKDRILQRFDQNEGYIPDFRDEDENPGPSSSYSLYTAFTITYLIRIRPENKLALLLKRAVEWNLKTLYPNGQPVDIFDERGRLKPYKLVDACYHSLQNRSTLFTFTKGGRDLIAYLEKNGNQLTPIDGIATDIYLYELLNKENKEFLSIMDDPKIIWFTSLNEFSYCYKNKLSAISKSNKWVIASHGYLSGSIDPQTMWHRELQQHFSLYYHGIGSIFGGGNSLGQSEFSTLTTSNSYLCDKVKIKEVTANSQIISLINGETELEIHINIISDNETNITCKTIAKNTKDNSFFQIPIACYAIRNQLLIQNKVVTEFQNKIVSGKMEKSFALICKSDTSEIKINCNISTPATYQWPVIPVNVREPGIPPLSIENAVLLISFSLSEFSKPISINLKIESNQI